MVLSGIEVLFRGVNFERLLVGLWVSIKISFWATLIGCSLGVFFGTLRVKNHGVISFLLKIYLACFRIIPILVWLYLFYFILPADFNLQLSANLVAILVFSLWVSAEMSDIVRGALLSLDTHQTETALALGLNSFQLYRFILIPLAVKRVLPGTLNLVTRVIKTTSLLVMIGVIDVVKVGQQIIEVSNTQNPTAAFWVYGFIFFLYFILCYPLSKVSRILEKKWAI